VDLAVRLGPLALANPVLVASGTFGYGDESGDLTEVPRLGGIVTKTLTLEPRAGNPPPRVAETPSGMLNSIGLENIGVRAFLRDRLGPLSRLGPAVIVSVGGRTIEEFEEMMRLVGGADGAAAIELNISCPNVKEGGHEWSASPEPAARVVAAARRLTRKPLVAKLSPNTGRLADVARACVEAGADILSLVNTYVGMAVDVRRRRPVLGAVTGGLSGPAIRPLAVARVHEAARAVRAPLIGMGGITCARDALEFMIVGASAVQVGTATFADPRAAESVLDGLRDFCVEEGIARITDLVGALRAP
jgi:dihydroorotate dehydrogenase (NAD+) catalytic subunit